jgi:hypothetical protein
LSKYDPYGECPEFREALGKIIGIPLDDLEGRCEVDALTDEDRAAMEHLNRLVISVVAAAPLSAQVTTLCNNITRDALVACISVPPATPDEDATQRIMRHILEIKRIARELS